MFVVVQGLGAGFGLLGFRLQVILVDCTATVGLVYVGVPKDRFSDTVLQNR